MEAGPRHHVGFRTKDVVHPFLDVDQFDEAEAWVISIEEKINIAVCAGLLPGDRAEQVQPRYPGTMKIGFIGAKRRDHEVSIHLPSPKPCNHHTALRTAVQFPCGDRLSRALDFGAIDQEGLRTCIDGLPEARGVLFLEPPDEFFSVPVPPLRVSKPASHHYPLNSRPN
jgi:hypothetical protein